jgi:hypothetical protein
MFFVLLPPSFKILTFKGTLPWLFLLSHSLILRQILDATAMFPGHFQTSIGKNRPTTYFPIAMHLLQGLIDFRRPNSTGVAEVPILLRNPKFPKVICMSGIE